MTLPGAAPGSIVVHPDARPTELEIIAYGPGQSLVRQRIADVDQCAEFRSRFPVVWLQVIGLADGTTIRRVGDVFGLHDLAMEDVVNVHQRPKVEAYGDHLFIVMHAARCTHELETDQISFFLGRNFVVSFQERPSDDLVPICARLQRSNGGMEDKGADYLAYALIDTVLDAYFPVVDAYSERIDALDAEIAVIPSSQIMGQLHDLRGDLMVLRRSLHPLRDALVKLMPDHHLLIGPETQFYVRDCYDHTVQLLDLLDTYREMCSDLRDYYLSSVSNRLNEIMKVLTIISTIFIPLSFITGIYGMNFNTQQPANRPELNWAYGYPLILTLMLAVGLGLLLVFWRRGWLGQDVRSQLQSREGS